MLRHTITKTILAHAESVLIIVLSALTTFSVFSTNGPAGAASIPNRRVQIGSSQPSVSTTHRFSFDIVSPTSLGSVEFEYCTNTPFVGGACTVPVGLSVSSATLTSQTGITGFSIHPTSGGNRLVLTRAAGVVTPQSVSYLLSNVANPSSPQETVFVRIATYSTDDGIGTRIDDGAVVFSTARQLTTSGYVPPYLIFCVGVTVALNCTTTNGDSIDLGELSKASPSAATSEFAGATNDVTGYSVGVYGNTMTSGNNLIPALAASGPSISGTSQYGLNLRRNNAPAVGQNPAGSGTAAIGGGYSSPNNFRFANGDTVVSSPTPTNFNKFTVSYLVNVAGNQQPGVYATTMTYIATASF